MLIEIVLLRSLLQSKGEVRNIVCVEEKPNGVKLAALCASWLLQMTVMTPLQVLFRYTCTILSPLVSAVTFEFLIVFISVFQLCL